VGRGHIHDVAGLQPHILGLAVDDLFEVGHEEAMRLYCRSLPEDHRRRYGAIEALKIGYGGVACLLHGYWA
jgi:hypothetical protein